jgi:hypothetical protein
MLGAPDVDPVVLTAALIREFGLADSTLRSIPAGETSWCFEATDRRGGRWFVKLTPEGAIDAVRAELLSRWSALQARISEVRSVIGREPPPRQP